MDRILARKHPTQDLIVIGRRTGRIITGTYEEVRDLADQVLELLAKHDSAHHAPPPTELLAVDAHVQRWAADRDAARPEG